MRRIILILCLLLISIQAYAAVGGGTSSSLELYQVFNQMFYNGNEEFKNNGDLFNSNAINYLSNQNQTTWCSEIGTMFRIEMAYAGSSYLQTLNAMGLSVTFDPNSGTKYYDVNNTFQVGPGFIWEDIINGTSVTSDPPAGSGIDSFMAFHITDSEILSNYYDQYGYDDSEIWVIAFDDPNIDTGNWADLVAVASQVPIPSSLFLMASGCSVMFFRRRKKC